MTAPQLRTADGGRNSTRRRGLSALDDRNQWRGNRVRWFNVLCASVLGTFVVIWLVPLVFALITSLKTEEDATANPTSWLPETWTVEAYTSVWRAGNMPVWYVNSFVVASLSALLTVLVCSMTGFALARTRFAGRRLVIGLMLAGIVIPGQILIIPMFQQFSALNLLNTYWAMILPGVASPIAVFIYMSFFRGIPSEIVDSARADGAGWFRIYWTLYMPLCKPATSAVSIFSFIGAWNSFMWPLLVLTSTKLMTIPVGLATVQSSYSVQYAQNMAMAILGALPLLFVFVLFQRRIVEGIATTGIK
ncbi:ABC transporter permease subunit [Streptomyces sp. 3MP-14]|uniref:ABC transporter permease subunit n=1 Tax=Streptomyces mimosae TaxID=2586635 RepID=A0A5N6AQR8_9ACTN|nr:MULTISPECIES: carbohydrate ABC transporter permease [Streptomyces]KAB8170954.1 ABC transporter permease subunit [Streptomyces mimosae]KAB8179695.1 ABC transporter permease subunit [Streptomyces sp. 3MP-14]